MDVRVANASDAQAIVGIHLRAVLEGAAHHYGQPELESWIDGVSAAGHARSMQEEGETYLLAIGPAGKATGFGSFKADVIKALYTSPDFARQGVASRLLGEMERAIAEQGYGQAKIGAAVSGLDFYLARGYRIECRRPWKTRGGLVLDACNICKELRPPT